MNLHKIEVTLEEAAKMIGVSSRTLRREIHEGRGPKIARKTPITIRVDELDRWSLSRQEALSKC